MDSSSRRQFLVTSVGAAITLTGSKLFAKPHDLDKTNTLVPSLKSTSEVIVNDGLAHPIPYLQAPGIGKDRALVLSGGGEYLLSWYMGYFYALSHSGVDLNLADIIVGTSAGSIAGAALSGDHLKHLAAELDFFTDFPVLLNDLSPNLELSASQKRALQTGLDVKDAGPSAIQSVGRAAMAAHTITGNNYATTLKKLVGENTWPSSKLFITATDCYTGERLVVSEHEGIAIQEACTASSSWPGLNGPTWLNDRYCMDGGVGQTATHADVVMGAKRVLIISLSDGSSQAISEGLGLSRFPNALNQEIKTLEADGKKTLLITAGLPPGMKSINLLDPKLIGPGLRYGYVRGIADASKVKAFWN